MRPEGVLSHRNAAVGVGQAVHVGGDQTGSRINLDQSSRSGTGRSFEGKTIGKPSRPGLGHSIIASLHTFSLNPMAMHTLFAPHLHMEDVALKQLLHGDGLLVYDACWLMTLRCRQRFLLHGVRVSSISLTATWSDGLMVRQSL